MDGVRTDSMKRRAMLASITGVITAVAGCAGGEGTSDNGTSTPASAAAGPIVAATESFRTALSEFGRYTGGVQQSGLDYSSETVNIALTDGRESLDAARDANPTDRQQTQIEYLATVATAIEASATAYGALQAAYEHLGSASSYVQADRRSDARDEIANAKDDFKTAQDQLETGLEEVRSALEIDVTLDTELTLVEWRQRLEQSVNAIDAVLPATAGYRHEAAGGWAYDDGAALIDEEDYDGAAEKFSEAFRRYGNALDDYRSAEAQATGDYKQTLIQRACRVEGLQNAAEAAFAGAKLYDDGAFEQGNEKFATAREQLNRDCE